MLRLTGVAAIMLLCPALWVGCSGRHLPSVDPGHPAHSEAPAGRAYEPSHTLQVEGPLPDPMPKEMKGSDDMMEMEGMDHSAHQDTTGGEQ